MSREIIWIPFDVHILTKDGIKIVKTEIPVYHDPEIDEDIVCPEGHDIIDNIKREYMLNRQ